MARRSLRSSVPTRHTTGIERPRCVGRLPSHISNTVVSTVRGGGGGGDSNPHGLSHMLLSHARLPFRHSPAISMVLSDAYS